jgi:hypothetical protein
MKTRLFLCTASVLGFVLLGCDKISSSIHETAEKARAESAKTPEPDKAYNPGSGGAANTITDPDSNAEVKQHNSLTDFEDQSSRDRRMKARESLGMH